MSWFDLFGKDLISIKDWTKDELDIVLRVTDQIKGRYYSGALTPHLNYKTFLMLFFNTSTRTRQSFETAMTQLGGHSQFIDAATLRISLQKKPGAGETIADTAKVMDRYCDGIGIRLLEDKVSAYGEGTKILYEFARYTKVPVINMASDVYHPCQALTDLYTMQERVGDLRGKRLAITWAYSPWVRSWGSIQSTAMIAARYGMEVVLAHPQGYGLDPDVIALTEEYARQGGGSFTITHEMERAVNGATVVYPRGWMSPQRYEIGKEAEIEMAGKYKDWIYTAKQQQKYGHPGYFLHCMPIDRGHEADDEVCDNLLSLVYDQAENRLHVQKAILTLTMRGRL